MRRLQRAVAIEGVLAVSHSPERSLPVPEIALVVILELHLEAPGEGIYLSPEGGRAVREDHRVRVRERETGFLLASRLVEAE
jgi:hypothetical protein